MSAEGHVLEKSDSSKSLVKYILVLAVFLGALWLSFQNDGPSKFPKQITDEFTFTAWVNDGEDYLKKNYSTLKVDVFNLTYSFNLNISLIFLGTLDLYF